MLNIAQTRQNMSFAQAVKRSIECFFFSEKSHWYDTIFFTSFQWQVFCLSNFFTVLTKWRLKFVPNYVCNHDKLIGVLSCRHPPLLISPVITNQIGLHSSYYNNCLKVQSHVKLGIIHTQTSRNLPLTTSSSDNRITVNCPMWKGQKAEKK